jgi:hypothetical protein
MARYSAAWSNVTSAALADTIAATNAAYPGTLRGPGAAGLARINEVYIGGMETAASNATDMILARASTISVGALSVGTNALLDAQATATATPHLWGNTAATSGPQRAATLYLLGLALNAYGGIARWQARVGEEITLFGNAVNVGEVFISAKTGTGKTSGHMIYETV